MDCQKFIENISEYVDAELSSRTVAECEEHLAQCPACQEELRQYRLLQKSLHAIPDRECPEELSKRIHEAIAAERSKPQLVNKARRFYKYAGIAAAFILVIGGGSFIYGAIHTGQDNECNSAVPEKMFLLSEHFDAAEAANSNDITTERKNPPLVGLIGYQGPSEDMPAPNAPTSPGSAEQENVLAESKAIQDIYLNSPAVAEALASALSERECDITLKAAESVMDCLRDAASKQDAACRLSEDGNILAVMLTVDSYAAFKDRIAELDVAVSLPDYTQLKDGILLIKVQ